MHWLRDDERSRVEAMLNDDSTRVEYVKVLNRQANLSEGVRRNVPTVVYGIILHALDTFRELKKDYQLHMSKWEAKQLPLQYGMRPTSAHPSARSWHSVKVTRNHPLYHMKP